MTASCSFLFEVVLRERTLGGAFYKRNDSFSQQRRSAYVRDAPADIQCENSMLLTQMRKQQRSSATACLHRSPNAAATPVSGDCR